MFKGGDILESLHKIDFRRRVFTHKKYYRIHHETIALLGNRQKNVESCRKVFN
jgi:hypothetical protein